MGRGFRIGYVPDTDLDFSATADPAYPSLLTLGGRDGTSWQNVQSAGGLGFSSGVITSAYTDGIATVEGVHSPVRHWSEITIHKSASYTPPDTHEVECLVGYTITDGFIAGYEIDFGWELNVQPIRLYGSIGNFRTDVFAVESGSYFAAVDGDVIRTYYYISGGNVFLDVHRNGSSAIVFSDSTAGRITSGNPGFGFYPVDGTGVDLTAYCISRYRCGNF